MVSAQLECKLARNYSLAEVEGAVAYLLVEVVPDINAEFIMPPLDITIILDISQSMYGEKLERAKEAACTLVNTLSINDWFTFVVFNDRAKTIITHRKVDDRDAICSQIRKIRAGGATRMFNGLNAGLKEIAEAALSNVKLILLFTDGQTEGDRRCLKSAQEAADRNVVISSFGIGDDYNEELLLEISRITLGSVYHLQHPEQIKEQFMAELESATSVGMTNAKLIFHLSKGVNIDEMYRIHPNCTELEVQATGESTFSAYVGLLDRSEIAYFGTKLNIPSQPGGRVRLARVVLDYDIPVLNLREVTDDYDVIVEYTEDRELCSKVDGEVIGYFNQLIVWQFVDQATKAAQSGDITEATQKLDQARILTQRSGNIAMTQYLQQALGELNGKGTISAGMQKTIRLGSTHTVKIEE